MKTLTAASVVSVLYTVSVWLFVVPRLVSWGWSSRARSSSRWWCHRHRPGLWQVCSIMRRGVRVDAARVLIASPASLLLDRIDVAAGLFTGPWFGVDVFVNGVCSAGSCTEPDSAGPGAARETRPG